MILYSGQGRPAPFSSFHPLIFARNPSFWPFVSFHTSVLYIKSDGKSVIDPLDGGVRKRDAYVASSSKGAGKGQLSSD